MGAVTMATRQKDRVYLRWIGPVNQQYGEFRRLPVELIGTTNVEGALVRFPDGTVASVHWDHLTDAPFRLEVAP